MNKRIEELIEQAGFTEGGYESDEGPWIGPEFNKEKFAELIVRECMAMCTDELQVQKLTFRMGEIMTFRKRTSTQQRKSLVMYSNTR